jgi:hypothetical protein
LRTERLAWLVAAFLVLLAFPLVHTFSTFVAATTLVAWLVAARHHLPLRRFALASALVAGFWGYFAGYYTLIARLGMTVPYVDRVTAHPGLFVAWLVTMAIGLWWYQRTNRTGHFIFLGGPFVIFFAVLFANSFTPVFPGTVPSPLGLALLIGVFLVPVVLAVGRASWLSKRDEPVVILLSLLAAPVTITAFSLTADLTPEYFATVMRVQTFMHPPVIALAAFAAARGLLAGRRLPSMTRRGLVVVFLVSLLLTAPIAYVDLDTLAFPSTTTESEFEAASFVATSVPGDFTSDHVLTRITSHYYGRSGSISPTAAWLDGGVPPACPVLSARSWTSTGAHFWPASPSTIHASQYNYDHTRSNLVYVSGIGYDSFAISMPLNDAAGC